MTLDGRTIVSGVMLSVFAGMVGLALTYPPQARFLPLVIGVPGLVLCLTQFALDLFGRREPAAEREKHRSGPDVIRREVMMFGWLAGFFAVVLLFGFLIGTPILLFAYLRLGERESTVLSLIAAGAGLAVIYGVFVELLALSIFDGFLIELFLS